VAGGRSRVIVWALAGAISFWVSGLTVSALWEDAPLLFPTLLSLVGPSVCFQLAIGGSRSPGRIAASSLAGLIAVCALGPWIFLAQGILSQGLSSIQPWPTSLDLVIRFPLASFAIATYSGILLALVIATLLALGICSAAGIVAVRNRVARAAAEPRA
jgi:hypothetical protein